MLQSLFQRFVDRYRNGLSAGFVAGLVILFLILLGIPVNLTELALFLLLLVIVLFGWRLARHLSAASLPRLVGNALVMGLVAALIALLFMSLINKWQADPDITVKDYFAAIDTKTMEVLSGVPREQLHANPRRNPLTDEYPEGAKLRANPLRLTLDEDTGLDVLGMNVIIGGFYGFMLLLIAAGLGATLLSWGFIQADLSRYWKRLRAASGDSPLTQWAVLLMPFAFFMLLWISVGHGTYNQRAGEYSSLNPIINWGRRRQDIQLLIGFGIIMWSLIALRAARPTDWGMSYSVRLGICLGAIVFMVALGIWQIVDSNTDFIVTPNELGGDQTLTVALVVLLGVILAAQNAFALRKEGRFETQLAATLALLSVMLMPLFLNQGQNNVLAKVGINVMLGLGLNIVVGYAGLLDLGYVAFFALGAYAYAFLSSNQLKSGGEPGELRFSGNDDLVIKLAGWMVITVFVTLIVIAASFVLWQRRARVVRRKGRDSLIQFPTLPPGRITALITFVAVLASVLVASWLESAGFLQDVFANASPFLVGLVVGVIVAGLSGIALGIPVLRLRGDYLAIVTLGFGEIIRLMLTNLRSYTGGPQGILEIPKPVPSGAPANLLGMAMTYLVFIGVAVVAFLSFRLKQSRTGRAWSAMRSDEDIAQSMGINLVQSKLTAFSTGAAFAGIGGVIFAALQVNVYPENFELEVSIEVLSLVIIGGMGSIPGVVMGAIALIGVPEVLRDLETYRILAFGALLIVMVIIRPEGLLPAPGVQLRERAQALVYGGIQEGEETK